MVAARRRSASSGPLRGLQRHVRRRARSCVQSNLPAMPTIGEGGLIPPISGQSHPPPPPSPIKGGGSNRRPHQIQRLRRLGAQLATMIDESTSVMDDDLTDFGAEHFRSRVAYLVH